MLTAHCSLLFLMRVSKVKIGHIHSLVRNDCLMLNFNEFLTKHFIMSKVLSLDQLQHNSFRFGYKEFQDYGPGDTEFQILVNRSSRLW